MTTPRRDRFQAVSADARCIAMVADVGEDLVVPAAVLIEVDYWLLKLYGHEPWRTFAEDVENGAYRLHPLSPHTLTRGSPDRAAVRLAGSRPGRRERHCGVRGT